MQKIILFILILLSFNGFAQFSKTHYLPPLTGQNYTVGIENQLLLKPEDHYLFISTPSTKNVNLKIIPIGGNVITAVVSKTTPFIYHIGTGDNTQLFTPKANIGRINNKGYIIEAEDLVYASIRINANKNPDGTYNHAGGLVSKGNSALGTSFRLGAMTNPLYDPAALNFCSILATENNTKITISNIANGTILSDGTIVTGPIAISLNKNESYVLALENYETSNSNSSKMIGAFVESDKAVIVNSGSFGGSNSTELTNDYPAGRDLGFDQIVPFEKTGKEYIFVKGYGTDEMEKILLIADKSQTAVYINGNTTPYITLNNPGDFVLIDGSKFINGNLYVSSSENVFAYQCISGSDKPANQNMFFVPPLNCATPNIVDNIPQIQKIGSVEYIGGLNIITEKGATVLINNNPINLTPVPITGNPNFERYTVINLSGNISVKSTKQVYVSYFGTNGAATYGGYYSGFDTKPEIVSDKIDVGASACIPNIELKVNSITPYDTFEWIFNNTPIANSNSNTYKPTQPGFYQVRGSISGCGKTSLSDIIPVSICPGDIDNDNTNDNVDIDNDNDGITNCTESYGNQPINHSNPNGGNISIDDYTNSFTGNITTSSAVSTTPFTGNASGSFVTEVPAGKGNFVNYSMTFSKPISIGFEYLTTANSTDLLNANAEYVIATDPYKTITILNPNNQLLIDTNYDGIYESGVTEYSSFEIRFQLNGTAPLAAGTGKFKFLTYLANSISFTHKNLSDNASNRTTLKYFAVCVPKDSDSDGIADQLDTDSDNDGILDTIEAQNNNTVSFSNTDLNKNGLSDAFEPGFSPMDTDNDGVPDYLDLDSDNDGIYDSVETGSNNTDTDGDGIKNYRELDSDNDSCYDAFEAGFSDSNNDGILGSLYPPTVDKNGVVTSKTDGYTLPNPNYITAAPIIITTQPNVSPTCELQKATILISDNGGSTYQWQVSNDGINWNNISDNSIYSGATTNTLSISSVSKIMDGYKYRVQLNKDGNSCGLLSNVTTLTVLDLPVLNNTTIVQCDDDSDGNTSFNLTVKNDAISANYENETFSYFTSETGARTNDTNLKIVNPFVFKSTNGTVWTRVENGNGCFEVAQIDLIVSVTKIPSSFSRAFENCDDYIDSQNDDYDGISSFDFSSVTSDIESILPMPTSSYSIKYYNNEADALAELNEITNTTNFRNINYPNEQNIWVRIDSNIDNSCYGLGPHITLKVNPKPNIDISENQINDELVCSNLPDFFITLDAGILDGSPASDYTYIWDKDNQVLIGETNPTLDVNTEGVYSVEVSSAKGCSRTRTIKVNASDIANISTIDINDLTEINSATVNATGQGNYEYSLDDENGPYQESNLFENIPSGIHEIYIRDKNGCGIVSQLFAVLGAPKYFTPNNDGFNDYWNIKGIDSQFNSKTVIRIFDRFGKFLKDITPLGLGWDGTFNGQPLPADDYWYIAKFEDGREIKGHFSLKR